jgi:hypothetical protein
VPQADPADGAALPFGVPYVPMAGVAQVKQGNDVIGIVVDAKGALISKQSESNERE